MTQPVRRSISQISLLFMSISAIIGSGWLFSAYYSAQIAGPAAIISWLIGGGCAIMIAFVFAEICSMIPISGSSARIPHFTHGSVLSFMIAWSIWLSYLALMATEVQSVVQYSSFYIPNLLRPDSGLTHKGYAYAAVLMCLVSFINVYSIRWLINSNNLLTLLKICIPLFIVFVILRHYFSPQHLLHPASSSFMPNGWEGIFSALTMGGIVFAFNGFKQGAELAGEAENPERSVKIAVVGSIAACLILFLLLQTSFLSSLTSGNLLHGWANLSLSNSNSPLAAIATQDKLNFLLPLLYFCAVVAPLAAGLMYCSSAGRSLYGMSQNGYLPKFFQKITPQGNPYWAIVANFAFGMLFFAPLPGWSAMVDFLTSLLVITYAVGPVCLLALRDQAPNYRRPLKLPFAHAWSYIAFVICTLLAYWSGWHVISKLGLVMALGLSILLIYHHQSKRVHRIPLHWRASSWLWFYLLGLTGISYFGTYGGGQGKLSPFAALVVIALFAAVTLWLSLKVKLASHETQGYLKALQLYQHEEKTDILVDDNTVAQPA